MSDAMQHVTPELRAWFAAQIAAGHSAGALAESMRASGWHNDAVAAMLQQEAMAARAAARRPAPAAAPDVKSENAGPAQMLPGPDLGGAALYLDAGDRRVQVVQSMESPRVVVFADLLAPAECEALIAAARARLARSLTVEIKTGGETLNADRTSEGMFFTRGENETVARIEQRIARLLNWPLENGEGLQVLRYQSGTQYRPHYDFFDPAEPGTPVILRRGGQRLASLVMYLQEPERGGATVFPDIGLSVAPVRGSAVFFSYARPHPDTKTLHGGAPVLAGEKWVATKWLREREFN